MENWKLWALAYTQEGLKPKEVAAKLETEHGMPGMYSKIRNYIHRAGKKDLATMQSPEKTTDSKRVVIQNQEPEHHEATWDGCEIVRFGLISDTHFDDPNCKLIDANWITPEEYIKKLSFITKNDTLILQTV